MLDFWKSDILLPEGQLIAWFLNLRNLPILGQTDISGIRSITT